MAKVISTINTNSILHTTDPNWSKYERCSRFLCANSIFQIRPTISRLWIEHIGLVKLGTCMYTVSLGQGPSKNSFTQDKFISSSRWKLDMKQVIRQGTLAERWYCPVHNFIHVVEFCRYFEGVQGDIKKKGELFGADNLFKLHENTLATKMAVRAFKFFVTPLYLSETRFDTSDRLRELI